MKRSERWREEGNENGREWEREREEQVCGYDNLTGRQVAEAFVFKLRYTDL